MTDTQVIAGVLIGAITAITITLMKAFRDLSSANTEMMRQALNDATDRFVAELDRIRKDNEISHEKRDEVMGKLIHQVDLLAAKIEENLRRSDP